MKRIRGKLPSRKELQNTFEVTANSYLESKKFLYVLAFYLVVRPVADRHGWVIDWGMGSVSFETKTGKHLYEEDSKAIQKIIQDLNSMLRDVTGESRCGILWDVMCGVGNFNRYHKDTGLKLIQ